MIPIEVLPDLPWSAIAKRQIHRTGVDVVQMSDAAYRIGNFAAAGFIYQTLTAPPWFWFVLAKGATMRDFIDLRRFQNNIPRGSLTGVEKDDAIALRFAKFYGFEETDLAAWQDNVEYLILRKK